MYLKRLLSELENIGPDKLNLPPHCCTIQTRIDECSLFSYIFTCILSVNIYFGSICMIGETKINALIAFVGLFALKSKARYDKFAFVVIHQLTIALALKYIFRIGLQFVLI